MCADLCEGGADGEVCVFGAVVVNRGVEARNGAVACVAGCVLVVSGRGGWLE